MTPLQLVPISAIDVRDRLRTVEPANVEALAASMQEAGLQQPIVVRRGASGENHYILVAGFHRVSAAKLLNWEEIGALVLDLTEEQARLVEIDENLIRRELSALDRAIFLAERKRIYEILHPEAKHGGDRKQGKDQVANIATWSRFSKEAAKKVGLSERAVQLAIEWVSRLSPDVIAALRSSSIVDNQAQLIALSELDAEQQLKVAAALASGASNVDRAQVAAGLKPDIKIDAEKAALAAFAVAMERLTIKQLHKRATMIANIITRKETAKEKGEEEVAKARVTRAAKAKAVKTAKRSGK